MDINSLHEDLYRMGNAGSPSFSESRGLKDCIIVEIDGIKIVKAIEVKIEDSLTIA
jgi:hypothetical protein